MSPDLRDRIEKEYRGVYSGGQEEIARRAKCGQTSVSAFLTARGLSRVPGRTVSPCSKGYSAEDRAVTAAFRAVIGYCPFHGRGEVTPKRDVAIYDWRRW